jgi:hypothetical protein
VNVGKLQSSDAQASIQLTPPNPDVDPMPARVAAVHAKGIHAFSKDTLPSIQLLAGQGVIGDAHCGRTVKH